MSLFNVVPAPLWGRALMVGLVLLLAASAGALVNGWRWEAMLATANRAHADALAEISQAAADRLLKEQAKRQELEERLQTQDSVNYRNLTNAQKDAARLRDRLATSELRLSVLINSKTSVVNCGVPTSAEAGSVVYDGARAELDPAHAQRIISITNYGDQGIIALKACQSYVREIFSQR